ncbi:pyrroline-5-carboxylate reductase [Anaerotignum sp.]|uniref:pyrroline-5-carboxylate reductase n=1 Tax=Anaerotignum sp. TaxID=2039241 RepID=UPI00271514CB|nr:pyrroline-5-carboxylate reductase [Anaerotignum sp.]
MKFGFIGAGNMVSAIVKGMTLGTGSYEGKSIFISSKSVASAKKLAEECGANACNTSREVIQNSDVVILGVKPNVLSVILPELQGDFAEKKPLVVSIAAGKTLEYLSDFFPEKTPIVRVMPNINAKIGASTTGLCVNEFVSEQQRKLVGDVFSTIGTVAEIEESQFSIFSVIGGASVAFAYLYMDALAHAALKAGMPKKQALQITAETVLGSAKMVLESNEAPWPLIDQVCSPGGTTIEGVTALQAEGFEATLVKAFDAVLAKDKAIGQKK